MKLFLLINNSPWEQVEFALEFLFLILTALLLTVNVVVIIAELAAYQEELE